MNNRISVHKFTTEKDVTFQPIEYSKFKFGCKDIARKYGVELAHTFLASKEFLEILRSIEAAPCRIIVLSSPYVHIPTATFAMKDYFVRELNRALVDLHCPPVLEAKMYRSASYKEEYGEMSKEQRFAVMSNDNFHVDASLLRGNIAIYLDDIVITGAHEHRVLDMIQKYDVRSRANYFLYYAQLTDGETNPVIENYLNYAFVKDLVCLDKIIKNENFLMNTRVVKYILDADPHECRMFLTYQKRVFLETLYSNAIGNSYHLIDDYRHNLDAVRQLTRD